MLDKIGVCKRFSAELKKSNFELERFREFRSRARWQVGDPD